MVSTTVFLTILIALVFGIATGYAAITGILRLMGHRSLEPATAPALMRSAEAGSGD